jgi:hypothetical protein
MSPTRSSKHAARHDLAWPIACGLFAVLFLIPVSASLAANTAAETFDTPPHLSHPVPVDLSDFEGHWQQIEVAESETARESSIETALGRLSWIVRRFAGGVLRKSTAPPAEMQFAWDGERLHQGMADKNGGFSRRIDLDDEVRVLKDSRGVDFASAWVWTGDGLRLRWEQHQATGNNFYRLDQNAQILIVEHMIQVTAISNIDPIRFRSRFSRTDLPARAAAGLDHVARVNSD